MEINSYLEIYKKLVSPDLSKKVNDITDLFLKKSSAEKNVYVSGNGASAAISSHIANDLTKACKIKARTFHDPALITCFGNDYGYENWIAESVNHFANEGDLIVLISSSGQSKNILNASAAAKKKNMDIISLTGPNPSNLLEANSDIHIRIDSNIYNIIECMHMIVLTAAIDQINIVTLNSEPPK
tara:strand:- start:1523 stop:2077 length:555 start_codon:yes stop_codon:yes gene_type:complete